MDQLHQSARCEVLAGEVGRDDTDTSVSHDCFDNASEVIEHYSCCSCGLAGEDCAPVAAYEGQIFSLRHEWEMFEGGGVSASKSRVIGFPG